MVKSEAWLGVRLSQAEHRAIAQRAKAAGLNMSEYVRICCTVDRTGPAIVTDAEELRKIHVDLRKVGGNLNQVARELNTHHRPNDIEDTLRAALAAVAQASEDVSTFISDARRSV